jgi:hypothetical protein
MDRFAARSASTKHYFIVILPYGVALAAAAGIALTVAGRLGLSQY